MTAPLSATPDRTKWALAYLAGRLRGYMRGSIKLPMVMGALDLALRNGVTRADAAALLADFGVGSAIQARCGRV